MSVAKKKPKGSTRDVVPGFGAAVRARRAALGMTLADVAEAAGTRASHVSDVELGRRSVGLRLALAIAAALDATVDELANGKS